MSKLPFVSRIQFIRSKLSIFSVHVSGVDDGDRRLVGHRRMSGQDCVCVPRPRASPPFAPGRVRSFTRRPGERRSPADFPIYFGMVTVGFVDLWRLLWSCRPDEGRAVTGTHGSRCARRGVERAGAPFTAPAYFLARWWSWWSDGSPRGSPPYLLLAVSPANGCPLIIETDFDIAFNKFIAVGSS